MALSLRLIRCTRFVRLVRLSCGIALLSAVWPAHRAQGQIPVQSDAQSLTASDGQANDRFGTALDVRGEVAIVGASQDDYISSPHAGSAQVFRWDGATWIAEQKLLAGVTHSFAAVGSAVAIEGDLALASSPPDSPEFAAQGSAWAFVRADGAWGVAQQLFAPDPAANDYFGSALALRGDLALISAPYHDLEGSDGSNAGAAYVFHWDGASWALEKELVAPVPATIANFGYAVGLDGDVAIVGAPGADPDPTGPIFLQGEAWIFRRDGGAWTPEGHLVADDAGPDDNFGAAVAIRGDVAAVGACNNINGFGFATPGAVYVFRRTGGAWVQEQKLRPGDGVNTDAFGAAVAIDGDAILVGAPRRDVGGAVDQGAAYLFRWTGDAWALERKLHASGGAAGDEFAAAVGIDQGRAVVGARLDDIGAKGNQGSASAFGVSAAPWTYLGQALAGASGPPSLVTYATLAPASPLVLSVAGAAPSAPLSLVVGFSVLDASFKGGVLVPVPNLVVGVFAGGSGSLTLSTSWPASIPSGLLLVLQAWMPDAGGPLGFAATNAVSATTP